MMYVILNKEEYISTFACRPACIVLYIAYIFILYIYIQYSGQRRTQSPSRWQSETDTGVLLFMQDTREESWFLRTEVVQTMAGVGIE